MTVVAVGVRRARGTDDTAEVGAGGSLHRAGRAGRGGRVALVARAGRARAGLERLEGGVRALGLVCEQAGRNASVCRANGEECGRAKTRRTRRESAVAVDEGAGEATEALDGLGGGERRERSDGSGGEDGAHVE